MLANILNLGPVAISIILSGLYVIYNLLTVVLDPCRDIPGPFLARFTKLWYFYKIWRGKFEEDNVALHKQYGPVVRIAPNTYSIDDVQAAKAVYGHGNAYVKSSWYWAWMPPDPNKASLFADLDPHRHGIQRRKYAAAYSMSSLVSYEPYVDNCTSLLKQRFHEVAASDDRDIDMGHWLQCYAFDVIGEITFGKRFGFLDMGLDTAGVFKAIEDRGTYSTFVGIFPRFHAWLFPLLPKTGGHGYVGNYTLSQMASREKEIKDPLMEDRAGPPDFMSRFLKIHSDTPEKMTKTDLFTICQSNIGAGSDTTAITLSACLYHLLKNPSTLTKLIEEIDSAAAEGKISAPCTFKETQELRYLQAVIKETLRLHPATGLPLLRVVPSSPLNLGSHVIPPASEVGINAWVAHRNAQVYGSDADIWRPERWLEIEEQGRAGEVEKYFFAFGAGSRTCIGRNISLLEMGKLIPELLRTFDFVYSAPGTWETCNRWFVKMVGFRVEVRRRN